MKPVSLFLVLLALASATAASAQSVVVNELLASNTATLADPDFGDYADWIELYNPANSAVDLSGYTLTDDLTEPARWRIPDGTTIPAGGYLILWADGENAIPPTASALHTDFKLSASGEQVGLYDVSGGVVDTLTYGPQTTDVSFGRVPEGSDVWAFMSTPTPGAANVTSSSGGIAGAPMVSLESGFFAGGETVELATAEAGGVVRYTLDGTEPKEDSEAYTAPLDLMETMVLRVATFAPDRIPSEVVTRTFFVGESSDLAVISLVTDPAGFFSDTSGIYVEGTNGIPGLCRTRPVNWNQDWEREVHLSFFEPTDTGFELVMDQGTGVQIFGGCSRIYPQKSLSLHARGRYGASAFDARLFPDLDLDTFDDLVLRSSAQDWWRTMFRDGMIQTLTRHMDLDGQAYRPTVVFLNGEYWGIHNLREKLNEDYVAGHYGISDEDVEVLDAEKLPLRGRSEHYDELLTILDTQDIRQPDVFALVEARMDVDQYL
ncbi:MAG: lamin tail domain-containing protein, partial [Bacteroidota bacterium]